MKRVFSSLFFVLVGAALTVVLIANPLQWSWVHPVQHWAAGVLGGSSADDSAAGLWTCGMHPQVISDKPGTCPICGMNLIPVKDSTTGSTASDNSAGERKIKYWVAPMDPTYISDKPGKSPMGMDLVPVYEGEEEQAPAGTVKIDPVFVQNIGVQSVVVERTDIPYTIRTIGTFTYNDQQMSWVTTKYDGWLERVHVNYVGEPVARGQKLFEIYGPRLVTTQKEYLDALDYAQRMSQEDYPEIRKRALALVESSRERLRYWDITDEQIEELEKTRQVRRTLTVVSPTSGLVVEKMDQALEGMHVQAGMRLYKIADLSTIWIEAEVFEDQVPWLKVGQTVEVDLPYQPGRSRTGRVRYIYPFFNNRTRTLKVSIELPNPGQRLRADMFADVTFRVPSARGVLAVPDEAVIHSGTRNVVVLDRGNGTFLVREVVLGVQGEGLWEVLDGITEGDNVVVSAQFLIDSESNLKEAIRKIIAAGEAPMESPAEQSNPEHRP